MNRYKLFLPTQLGQLTLKNRIVMAPMTRCRAIGNVPNDLMAEFYGQRAGAGLIITEGTAPSPNGLGYARMPGCFSKVQVEGWKKTTNKVHKAGGKIFLQLMHTGRISNSLNLHEGAHIIAPSAVKASGQIWTDSLQLQDFPVPKQMDDEDLLLTLTEFVASAKHAIDAGFDGVELHAANGYLLEQFLSPFSNMRIDKYGGSIVNRCRFVLEVIKEVSEVIGKEKTGVRLSPFGVASDMPHYPEIDETYTYLAEELNKLGIAYLHIVDHSSMGAPEVPVEIKIIIRNRFKNTLILSGGYNRESAEAAIENSQADLIAFGRMFINNPDLVKRMKNHWPMSHELNMEEFYTANEKGYTDYPVYKE
ncbi:MAG: alkene reductase [Paludibacter sp.]